MATYQNGAINIDIPGFEKTKVNPDFKRVSVVPPVAVPSFSGASTVGGIGSIKPATPPVRQIKGTEVKTQNPTTTTTPVPTPTQSITDVTSSPSVADVAPTQASTPSYDYTNLEDIYKDKTLTSLQRRRYLAQYYQSKGLEFDPNNFPQTYEDATMDFLGYQKDQKSALDKQIEYEKQQGQKSLEQNMSAVSSRLSTGREGPASPSNPLVAKQVTGNMVSQFQQSMDRLAQQKNQLAQMQKDQQQQWIKGRDDQILQMQQAIAEQETKLAAEENQRAQNSQSILTLLTKDNNLSGLSQEDIDYLQQALPGIPSGVLAVLANSADKNAQIEEQKRLSEAGQQRFENQQKGLDTFLNLVSSGVVFNNEALMQMSASTGLPLETLLAFNEQAQAINTDKSLDTATKSAKLQELGMQLDRQQRGIVNADLEKLDYVNRQVEKWQADGMSIEDIVANRQELLQNLGIKSTDDPLYQIELQKGILQNKALSIANKYLDREKIAEIESKILANDKTRIENKYLPDELERKNNNLFYENIIKELEAKHAPEKDIAEVKKIKAEADLKRAEANEALGITAQVYVPTKSKFKVEQTPNGIKVDIDSINQSMQCGRFVNQYVGIPGWVGDSYQSKLDRTQEGREPHAGDIFVTPAGGQYAANGHIGVVESVNPDGTINTVDANSDGKMSIRRHSNVTVTDNMRFGENPNAELISPKISDQPALLSVPKEVRTEVTQKANQFDGEQTVKNFQQVQSGYTFAKNLDNNSTNPADDIGLIYAFAKVMDPNSVVREGEYNTVQKYAQTWADTFGFQANRVFSNTNFLTPEARKNLKATLLQKYNNEKGQYDNVRDQYIKSIDSLAGKNVGESILQDYSIDESDNGLNSYLDSINSESNDPYQQYLNSLQ